MSLRRFRIKAAEHEKVHAWIKKQKVDEEADEKSPEPLAEKGFAMPADYLPKVVWAHKASLKLDKVAHGKEIVLVLEKGVWKRLVDEKQIDGYLREVLLSSNADVPMSRDAGYHIVQKDTVGISRRAFAKFISKQAVLQITRDALPEKKNPGRPLEGRGYLELDLVEAKGKDIGKFVHHPVKDFYWITLIDRLTGWLEVQSSVHKDVKSVAPKIKQMLRKMSASLRTDIKYIRSDSGSEFKSDTQAVFKELHIRHRFVKSGNRIEQANKTYQKIWYRIMRLGRGDLRNINGVRSLDVQAQAIFNNTLSSINGKTPLEALETDDKVLSAAFNASRKRVAKYKSVPIEKGDLCRYLLDSVRGKYGVRRAELKYKSYRGKHWSAEVYTVVKVNSHEGTYYVARDWRQRDKLLKVPGVDATTRDLVNRKHRLKKKDWEAEIGDLAL